MHNGIIENYIELKKQLLAEGHKFQTETDTEIIAHLLEKFSKNASLEEAVLKAVKVMGGAYALVARLHQGSPTKSSPRASARPSSSGSAKTNFSSPAIFPRFSRTRAASSSSATAKSPCSRRRACSLLDFESHAINRPPQHITWDPIMAEKGGFKHFMQKEIFEQPRAVRDTLLGRISQETGKVFLDEMDITEQEFKNFRDVKIVACGTSWHAGLAGKFMIERLAHLPVEVDYGSEYRYRDPIVDKHSLVIAISQSGETADTLAAEREARQKGAKVLAICNVVGSMLTREANGTIYTHAGPEIGVASTKAFTGQLSRASAYRASSRPGARQAHLRRLAESHAGTHAHPAQDRKYPPARRRNRRTRPQALPPHRFSLSRPRNPLSHRARRRAEAQGNFLHPRRRLSRPAK